MAPLNWLLNHRHFIRLERTNQWIKWNVELPRNHWILPLFISQLLLCLFPLLSFSSPSLWPLVVGARRRDGRFDSQWPTLNRPTENRPSLSWEPPPPYLTPQSPSHSQSIRRQVSRDSAHHPSIPYTGCLTNVSARYVGNILLCFLVCFPCKQSVCTVNVVQNWIWRIASDWTGIHDHIFL